MMTTVVGRTLQSILEEFELPKLNLPHLTAKLVKQKCRYFRVPVDQQWRLPLLTELLQVRNSNLLLGEFEAKKLKT